MASKGYKTVLRIKGSTGNMEDDKVVNATSYINKKGKRKFYDVSDVYVDTQGNRLGTMSVPTIQQRKKAAEEQDRQRLGIKSVEQTQKTLKQADKEFDVASRKFENALSKELQKTGIDYRTRFEDMSKKKISYQTKNEDKPKNQPTPIPIVETSKKLKKELAEKEKAYNKWKVANYENNLAEVYDEKTTTWDKTGGHVTRALKDLVSPLTTGDDNVIYDENGNKTFLPSRSELKQQKVRGEMSGVGGALADIGYNATKILGAGAIDLATAGMGGKALYWTDMATDNYKNVINQGYDQKSAIANTIISTGSEFLTERLMGAFAQELGGAKKASGLKEALANSFYKATQNPKIANLLASMTSEGLEEGVQELIGALNNKITLGQDTNIDDLIQDSLYSALIGAGTGGLVTGVNGNIEGNIAAQQLGAMNNTLADLNALQETNKSRRITNAIKAGQEFVDKPFTADFNKVMEKVDKLNEVERTRLTEITQKRLAGEMLDQNDLDVINYLNNRDEMQTDLSTKTQGVAPQELKPVDTSDKVLNFRNSVENEGIQDADGFYKAAEKIIQDKDYNVILDSSIKNEKGKSVNAVISNENGITIRINPKSNRAGEILLTHEITHGIETKAMSDLITNYAQKDAKFNDALQSLKRAYGTEDITPEVVADISGQLFGNQEFISNLSTENPNLFKKIYDKIIEIANKITGNSNESLFIKDLQNKWEKAYRESTIESSQQNLKEGAKFSQNAEIEKIEKLLNGESPEDVKTDSTTDNKGVKLTEDQQEFYKDSKIRDENGALIRVYHTVNHPVIQFNEFNPVGTRGYRFDDQVVIYSTSSKMMSGSYANQIYDMAEGEKLNTIKEAQNWLKTVRPDLDIKIDGLKVFEDYGGGIREEILSYKSKDDLLRNLKSGIQKEYGEAGPLQYEAYLDMKNPFVVESYGESWKTVSGELNEVKAEIVNKLKDEHRTEIVDLAKESKEKYREFRDGNKKKELDFSCDILTFFKNPELSDFFENEMNVGSDWTDLHEFFRDADDYEDFLSNFEMFHYVLDEEAMQKAMEEQGITQEDFDKMSDEEKTEFEEQFEKEEPVYSYDVELPDADEKLSDLIDKSTLEFYEEKSDTIPFYKDLKNKTFGEFMDELFDLYNEASVFEDEHSYFDEMLDLDEIFGRGADDLFEGDSLFMLGEYDFDDDSIDMLTKDPMETNDVVKMIIAENKSRPENEKYDGIIFKGIYDYAGYSDLVLPEDVYVVFNANQIKSVENKHPTKDPDWRYAQYVNKWQKWLEEKFPSRGTTTNLKEHIKTKKQIKKDMIDKGVKPKVAEILTETPRAEEKKSSLREDWHKLKRKFVDKGEAVYRLAKKTKNRLLYAMYDKMGTSVGEANYHIGEAQTTLKGNAYRNFTDKEGKKVSMSLNQIWDGIDEKIANEYLAHYLNMDRYKQKNLSGENRYVFGESVTDKDSAKRVKELEKAHPELKRFGENVWQYGRNQLKNMVDSGMISKEQAEQFVLDTPHYVRLQRNVSKGSKNKIEVDKDGNARVNKQIKEFKGSDLDILPFKETMAQYTVDVIQSMRANLFGQELAKTLGMSATNDTVDSVDEIFGFNPDLIKDNGDGTYSFTIFNKGQAITVPIDEGIYEALQPNKKYDIEDAAIFSGKFGIRNADKFRRSLLTDKNPLFLATNMLKDLFDAPLNSQHPVAFAANYIPAIKQIITNGKYYQQYKSLGGLQNTYFDHKEGFTKQRNKLNPVGWFEKANNAVEQFPRLAEFMATMKATGNPEEAMYNAAEITTNFKRGGDITKAINRNGGTFLNASVQGFSRFVRNFTDIQNPQQAVKMLAKIIALGIGPALINDMVYDDDDEYKDLQDYIKDNYYLIKGKNGTWVRIPKGRAVSVFQDAARRTKYRLRGDKDAYKGLWSTFKNQVAPNNVFDSNIVSPFVQVAKNKSWSGNPIVSDYTKNAKHPEEEYDVKTDELSKWLGKTFHYSPKKINYIIDQYSGVIGDFALPIGTKYAESNSDSKLYQALVNPALNKFTTNSVTSSKVQQEFYQALQDAEDDRYWSKGTSKDTAVHKYLSSKNREISAIRSEMTKLQESNKPDSEKFEGALEYQKQINEIAKDAVKQSKKIKETNKKEYEIGGNYYAGKDASAIKPETVEKAQNVGLSIGEWQDISTYKNEARADKRPDGTKIYGSAKQKVINYVYSKEELTEAQKKKILEQLYPKR